MMACAKGFLAEVCSRSGATACLRYLNRGRKKVLTFHNVLPDSLMSRYPKNSVCESESRFRAIIRLLAKRYRFSTDLNDPSTLTITFDDGYCNEGEVAGRILQEEGDIPAVVFASGKALNSVGMETALCVDRLLYWCDYAPDDAVMELTGFTNRRDAWLKVMRPAFCRDAQGRGEHFFARCDGIYPFKKIVALFDDEYRRLRFSGISEARLGELRSRGWVFGWHTNSHFQLGALPSEDVREEMTPRDDMRGLPMSYPYGHEEQVGAAAVAVAEEFGFPVAYADQMDPCALSGRWFAPRFEQFEPKSSSLEFELSGMKYFLKHHSLLPEIK